MANVLRTRWNPESNPTKARMYPVALAETVDIGDLMWWDRASLVARPASATQAWTGSAAGTQGKIAENFLGVAESAHVANDANVTEVRIGGAGVVEMDVATPTTFEIGDLVTPVRDGANNYMLDQTVDKASGGIGVALGEPSRCIGKVAKRYSSTTASVEFEILGRNEPAGGITALLSS